MRPRAEDREHFNDNRYKTVIIMIPVTKKINHKTHNSNTIIILMIIITIFIIIMVEIIKIIITVRIMMITVVLAII